MQKKERANTIIIRALMHAVDNTLSVKQIIDLLLTTRYATTAYSHAVAYCNDMRVYQNAIVTYDKQFKTVTHVKLCNAECFNIETGFRLRNDEISAKIEKNLESENEIQYQTMSLETFEASIAAMHHETVNAESSVVAENSVLMLTDDSDATRHAKRVESVLSSHDLTKENDVVILATAAKSAKRVRARKAA